MAEHGNAFTYRFLTRYDEPTRFYDIQLLRDLSPQHKEGMYFGGADLTSFLYYWVDDERAGLNVDTADGVEVLQTSPGELPDDLFTYEYKKRSKVHTIWHNCTVKKFTPEMMYDSDGEGENEPVEIPWYSEEHFATLCVMEVAQTLTKQACPQLNGAYILQPIGKLLSYWL